MPKAGERTSEGGEGSEARHAVSGTARGSRLAAVTHSSASACIAARWMLGRNRYVTCVHRSQGYEPREAWEAMAFAVSCTRLLPAHPRGLGSLTSLSASGLAYEPRHWLLSSLQSTAWVRWVLT